jgi:hypothetical protein
MAREIFSATEVIAITANQLYAVKCPSKAWLTRFMAVGVGGPSGYVAKLYNRAFSLDAPISLRAIISTEAAGAYSVLEGISPLPFAVGDRIVVAGSDYGPYNTTHRVSALLDSNHVVVSTNYASYGLGGTVNLSVPSTERDLYKILSVDASGILAEFDGPTWVPVINADPLPAGKASKDNPYIYFTSNTTGSYRLSFTYLLPC